LIAALIFAKLNKVFALAKLNFRSTRISLKLQHVMSVKIISTKIAMIASLAKLDVSLALT